MEVALFFLTASGIWLAAHVYVGLRLIRPLALPRRRRLAAWAAVLVLFSIAPATMALGRALPHGSRLGGVEWVGFVYMGLFALVVPFLVVRDVLAGVPWLAQRARRLLPAGNGAGEPTDPKRRAFMLNASNAAVLGASGVLTGWGFYEARRLPEVERVEVPIDGLPAALDGYRIAQLTDIHVGPTIRGDWLSPIVDVVDELEPDLVAITGDLVDGYVDELRDHVAPLGRLSPRDGTFFVTGNHEYYWEPEAWLEEVRRLGMTVLEDEHRIVERDGARLLVAGVPDYREGRRRGGRGGASDPARAREGAPAHDVSLLLAHQPKSLPAAVRAGYDLQVSGHTHGGQFFPFSLFVGFAHPVAVGLQRWERTWIYVSRGTGYWGPPLRAGVPAEITEITLRPGGSKSSGG